MKRVIPIALALLCSVASAQQQTTDLMADPLFMAKVASFHGMTPVRLANQSEDRVRQMVLDYLESQRIKPSKKAEKHGSGTEPVKTAREVSQ